MLSRHVPKPVAESVTVGGLVLAGWGLVATMERRHPFRDDWNEPHGDTATDIADLLVSDGWGRSAAAALTAPLRNAIASRRGTKRGPLARLPVGAQVAVMVSAYDFGHYWMHRIMHEGAGWRIHAPHHSAERLYWLNATRFHPVELAIDGIQESIVLALLGPSGDAMTAFTALRGIYGQIQHANVDMDSGPLNAVLSTPERHRWHHSVEPSEGNSNYGAIVSIWDTAFGSATMPDREFDAPIGLGDPDYPKGWVGQLAAPITAG